MCGGSRLKLAQAASTAVGVGCTVFCIVVFSHSPCSAGWSKELTKATRNTCRRHPAGRLGVRHDPPTSIWHKKSCTHRVPFAVFHL